MDELGGPPLFTTMWRRAKTSGNGVNVFLSYPNEKRGPSREITASSSSGQHFEGKIFINNSGYFEVNQTLLLHVSTVNVFHSHNLGVWQGEVF